MYIMNTHCITHKLAGTGAGLRTYTQPQLGDYAYPFCLHMHHILIITAALISHRQNGQVIEAITHTCMHMQLRGKAGMERCKVKHQYAGSHALIANDDKHTRT